MHGIDPDSVLRAVCGGVRARGGRVRDQMHCCARAVLVNSATCLCARYGRYEHSGWDRLVLTHGLVLLSVLSGTDVAYGASAPYCGISGTNVLYGATTSELDPSGQPEPPGTTLSKLPQVLCA